MDNYRQIRLGATTSTIAIARGTLARIDNAQGTKVQVRHGFLWITQHGCSADICVDAGETYTIERQGTTILSACGNSAVSLVVLDGPAMPAPAASMVARLRERCLQLVAPWPPRPAIAAH